MVTKEYEYKTIRSSPTRFGMHEIRAEGHRWTITKRRRYQSESAFTGFRPRCSCKWTLPKGVWCRTLERAMDAHSLHCKDINENHPRLEGL